MIEDDLTLPSDEAVQLKRIADALETIVKHMTGKVTYSWEEGVAMTTYTTDKDEQ